jgi:hypothetical protein
MTLIAEVPLVLLVVAIGETPRHYVAVFPVLAVAASIGWVAVAQAAWAGERWGRIGLVAGIIVAAPFAFIAARRVLPVVRTLPVPFLVAAVVILVGLVVLGWLLRRGGSSRAWVAPVLALVLLVGAGSLAGAVAARSTPSDAAKQQAADTAAAWIEANVPPGTTVAVTARLGYETARRIAADHPVVRILARSAVVRADAPMGLRRAGSSEDITDPVVATPALFNGDLLDVFAFEDLQATIADRAPAYWVVHTLGVGEGALPTMLDHAAGATKVAEWSFPSGSEDAQVAIFRLDPGAFQPDAEVLFADPAALDRIIRKLDAAGPGAGVAATALRERIVITPPAADDAGLLARLEALRGR